MQKCAQGGGLEPPLKRGSGVEAGVGGGLVGRWNAMCEGLGVADVGVRAEWWRKVRERGGGERKGRKGGRLC